MANSLSMYGITENIYYSQLSSVAILLQPEPNCFTSYSTRKGLCSLSVCYRLTVSPSSHVSTSNGQRISQLFCVHCTRGRAAETSGGGRRCTPPSQWLRLNLNSVNQLIFVLMKYGVVFEVRTEFLNNI
jgi:hypothetical protein